MSDGEARVGAPVTGSGRRRIGTVDAVFADYLLVRTSSAVPVDLYVPRPDVRTDGDVLDVGCTAAEAYRRWHRPLKRAPHD